MPAFVEHRPRRILQAREEKIPIIVFKECGIGNLENIETVKAGNACDLREKILSHLVKTKSFHIAKL